MANRERGQEWDSLTELIVKFKNKHEPKNKTEDGIYKKIHEFIDSDDFTTSVGYVIALQRLINVVRKELKNNVRVNNILIDLLIIRNQYLKEHKICNDINNSFILSINNNIHTPLDLNMFMTVMLSTKPSDIETIDTLYMLARNQNCGQFTKNIYDVVENYIRSISKTCGTHSHVNEMSLFEKALNIVKNSNLYNEYLASNGDSTYIKKIQHVIFTIFNELLTASSEDPINYSTCEFRKDDKLMYINVIDTLTAWSIKLKFHITNRLTFYQPQQLVEKMLRFIDYFDNTFLTFYDAYRKLVAFVLKSQIENSEIFSPERLAQYDRIYVLLNEGKKRLMKWKTSILDNCNEFIAYVKQCDVDLSKLLAFPSITIEKSDLYEFNRQNPLTAVFQPTMFVDNQLVEIGVDTDTSKRWEKKIKRETIKHQQLLKQSEKLQNFIVEYSKKVNEFIDTLNKVLDEFTKLNYLTEIKMPKTISGLPTRVSYNLKLKIFKTIEEIINDEIIHTRDFIDKYPKIQNKQLYTINQTPVPTNRNDTTNNDNESSDHSDEFETAGERNNDTDNLNKNDKNKKDTNKRNVSNSNKRKNDTQEKNKSRRKTRSDHTGQQQQRDTSFTHDRSRSRSSTRVRDSSPGDSSGDDYRIRNASNLTLLNIATTPSTSRESTTFVEGRKKSTFEKVSSSTKYQQKHQIQKSNKTDKLLQTKSSIKSLKKYRDRSTSRGRSGDSDTEDKISRVKKTTSMDTTSDNAVNITLDEQMPLESNIQSAAVAYEQLCSQTVDGDNSRGCETTMTETMTTQESGILTEVITRSAEMVNDTTSTPSIDSGSELIKDIEAFIDNSIDLSNELNDKIIETPNISNETIMNTLYQEQQLDFNLYGDIPSVQSMDSGVEIRNNEKDKIIESDNSNNFPEISLVEESVTTTTLPGNYADDIVMGDVPQTVQIPENIGQIQSVGESDTITTTSDINQVPPELSKAPVSITATTTIIGNVQSKNMEVIKAPIKRKLNKTNNKTNVENDDDDENRMDNDDSPDTDNESIDTTKLSTRTKFRRDMREISEELLKLNRWFCPNIKYIGEKCEIKNNLVILFDHLQDVISLYKESLKMDRTNPLKQISDLREAIVKYNTFYNQHLTTIISQRVTKFDLALTPEILEYLLRTIPLIYSASELSRFIKLSTLLKTIYDIQGQLLLNNYRWFFPAIENLRSINLNENYLENKGGVTGKLSMVFRFLCDTINVYIKLGFKQAENLSVDLQRQEIVRINTELGVFKQQLENVIRNSIQSILHDYGCVNNEQDYINTIMSQITSMRSLIFECQSLEIQMIQVKYGDKLENLNENTLQESKQYLELFPLNEEELNKLLHLFRQYIIVDDNVQRFFNNIKKYYSLLYENFDENTYKRLINLIDQYLITNPFNNIIDSFHVLNCTFYCLLDRYNFITTIYRYNINILDEYKTRLLHLRGELFPVLVLLIINDKISLPICPLEMTIDSLIVLANNIREKRIVNIDFNIKPYIDNFLILSFDDIRTRCLSSHVQTYLKMGINDERLYQLLILQITNLTPKEVADIRQQLISICDNIKSPLT